MTTSTAGLIITQWVNDISSVLAANLPAILLVAGALFALSLLVRQGKRFIGGR